MSTNPLIPLTDEERLDLENLRQQALEAEKATEVLNNAKRFAATAGAGEVALSQWRLATASFERMKAAEKELLSTVPAGMGFKQLSKHYSHLTPEFTDWVAAGRPTELCVYSTFTHWIPTGEPVNWVVWSRVEEVREKIASMCATENAWLAMVNDAARLFVSNMSVPAETKVSTKALAKTVASVRTALSQLRSEVLESSVLAEVLSVERGRLNTDYEFSIDISKWDEFETVSAVLARIKAAFITVNEFVELHELRNDSQQAALSKMRLLARRAAAKEMLAELDARVARILDPVSDSVLA